jgi:hypothetical protein
MKKRYMSFAGLLTLVALLFTYSFALAVDTPATVDQERNHSRLPAGTPFVRGGTDQLTILIAISDYGTYEADEVRDSLISYGVADVVDYFDAQVGTPSVADMEPYDCVICWPNYTYANATQFGDNLADYADGGGAVVLPQFNFYSGWALQGRIMTAGYSPWSMTSSGGYSTHSLGWYDPTHPVMDGVTSGSAYFCFDVTEQGNVEDIAHYDNDYKLAAVSEDNAVGALNLYYGETYAQWTGDFMRILGNMVMYVTGGGPEATMRCQTLSPVFCRGKKFYFKLTVKNNTEDNISGTLTFSGYADYDCDPANSLVGIRRYKTYVPGATEEYYMFKVPPAAGPGPYSASVGGTMAGVDLFCCMNTEIIQCEPWRTGDNTEWSLEQVERPDAALPTTTALHQNYPNPFNAETNISFSLADAGNVSLNVYDLSGRLVTTLVDGQMDAGEHVVSWDASSVSSGVYFLRLATADFSATKTMNLLK